MPTWVDHSIEQAVRNVARIAADVRDFPHVTENGGQWTLTPDGVWTGGFWAGLLWLAYEHSKDVQLRTYAEHFTDRLLPSAHATHNHDLGFMFFPSAIKGWQLTGEQRYHQAALDAAHALADQFNPAGGFIPGWGFFGSEGWGGAVLIDTMMNVPLLVWAAKETGETRLADIARKHSETSLRHHVRTDGSVYHVFNFDPDDGTPQGGATYQGFGAESAWTRGQAWAITGCAIMLGMTGESQYLETARRVGDFFLSQLPADNIPPWDFRTDGGAQPKDSSAGAIASYGFQKLYRITGEKHYLDTAVRLLKAAAQSCGNSTGKGGLLLHGTADLPHGLGIDGSVMYGDYYYLKSLVAVRPLLA